MDQQTKTCKYCKKENFIDNRKCLHCGRFFPVEHSGGQNFQSPPPVRRPDPVLQVDHIKLIPAGTLLISLFLPWLSWFVVRLTAFDIAGFFKLSAQMAGRASLTMSLIQICIYMIIPGCAIYIFRVITGRTIKVTGVFTGILPVLTFFLVITQPAGVLRMISFGFILAIFSGIALIILSLKEPE